MQTRGGAMCDPSVQVRGAGSRCAQVSKKQGAVIQGGLPTLICCIWGLAAEIKVCWFYQACTQLKIYLGTDADVPQANWTLDKRVFIVSKHYLDLALRRWNQPPYTSTVLEMLDNVWKVFSNITSGRADQEKLVWLTEHADFKHTRVSNTNIKSRGKKF